MGQYFRPRKNRACQIGGGSQMRIIGSYKFFCLQLFQLRIDLGLPGLLMPVGKNLILLDHAMQLRLYAPLGQGRRFHERLDGLLPDANLAQSVRQECLWRSLRGHFQDW